MLLSIQRSLVSRVAYTNGDLGEGLGVGTLLGVDGQMAQLCAGDVSVQAPLSFSPAALAAIRAAWPAPVTFSNTLPGTIPYQTGGAAYMPGIFLCDLKDNIFPMSITGAAVAAANTVTCAGYELTNIANYPMYSAGARPFKLLPTASPGISPDFGSQVRLRPVLNFNDSGVVDSFPECSAFSDQQLELSASSVAFNNLLADSSSLIHPAYGYGEITRFSPLVGKVIFPSAYFSDAQIQCQIGLSRDTVDSILNYCIATIVRDPVIVKASATLTLDAEISAQFLTNSASADSDKYVMITYNIPSASTMIVSPIGLGQTTPSLGSTAANVAGDRQATICIPLSAIARGLATHDETNFDATGLNVNYFNVSTSAVAARLLRGSAAISTSNLSPLYLKR